MKLSCEARHIGEVTLDLFPKAPLGTTVSAGLTLDFDPIFRFGVTGRYISRGEKIRPISCTDIKRGMFSTISSFK